VQHVIRSGKATNLRLARHGAGVTDGVFGNWYGFEVQESSQGQQDLNSDGDPFDLVYHFYDLDSGTTLNLGLARTAGVGGRFFVDPSADRCFLTVLESAQGALDLNGDGDIADSVLHTYDFSSRIVTNLELSAEDVLGFGSNGGSRSWNFANNWLFWPVDGSLHLHNLSTGITTNFGLAGQMFFSELFDFNRVPNGVPISFSERQGLDLNGDGDFEDGVFHVWDFSTGRLTNLRLDSNALLALSDNWLGFPVREPEQGEDLDGDGEIAGQVVHLHDLCAGRTTNLRLQGGVGSFEFYDERVRDFALSEEWLVFYVDEQAPDESVGQDRNGDGDTEDDVYYLHNLLSGSTTNLGLASSLGFGSQLSGSWLLLQSEQPDGWYLVDLRQDLASIFPGDCNLDGQLDISDGICLFGFLFLGSPKSLPCADGTPENSSNLRLVDWNADEQLDISDGIGLLTFLFLGGPPHASGCGCISIEECPDVCE
jgi:hypothetical protein